MGRDAYIYIPKRYNKKDIKEIIELLNYVYARKDVYFYKPNDNYKFYSGIVLFIEKSNKQEYKYIVHVRTQAYATNYDIEKQNNTLKIFKQYFNCNFDSDCGKNRYFEYNTLSSKGAENGCFLALERSYTAFSLLELFLQNQNDSNIYDSMKLVNLPSPNTLCANISLSYLCSILEDYFRNVYIAILTQYDNKKEKLYKECRIDYEDLVKISKKELILEEVLARKMSFQNIHKITCHFKELNNKIDLNKLYRNKRNRRKQSYYDLLNRIFEQRHYCIHHLDIDLSYDCKILKQDIIDIKKSLQLLYDELCKIYKWKPQ